MDRQTVEDFTEEQIRELREVFDLFDKNRDGTLSCCEIRTVMQAIGQNTKDAEIAEMLKKYDDDRRIKNGTLDCYEFLTMIADKMKDLEKELRNAFKLFDKNKDGMVSVEELRTIVTKLGDKMSEEEFDEIFGKADVDKN